MKGVVFTEFLEMVEKKFGDDMVDELIEENEDKLTGGGAYTAIGTYPFEELVALVVSLHHHTSIPISDLIYTFGRYLCGTFVRSYSLFFDAAQNTFDFLESIENYIHVEVRKLYPDAELPSFATQRIGTRQLEMVYTSERAMGDLARGLIDGTSEHFGEQVAVEYTNVSGDGKKMRFLLTKG